MADVSFKSEHISKMFHASDESLAWEDRLDAEGEDRPDDWALLEQLVVQELAQDIVRHRRPARKMLERERTEAEAILDWHVNFPRARHLELQRRQRYLAPRYERFTVARNNDLPSPEDAMLDYGDRSKVIHIGTLLAKGSILMAGVNLLSLLSWMVYAAPLINPFVSTLILACLPFSYWMGVRLRRGNLDGGINPQRRTHGGTASLVGTI